MAKHKEIAHANRTGITKLGNPIRWKWRSCKNWVYDKWMRWRGYVPTVFQPYNNCYMYEKRSEVNRDFAKELEPIHELVGYKKKNMKKSWWHHQEQHDKVELEQGHKQTLSALRNGDTDNECIIRRTL